MDISKIFRFFRKSKNIQESSQNLAYEKTLEQRNNNRAQIIVDLDDNNKINISCQLLEIESLSSEEKRIYAEDFARLIHYLNSGYLSKDVLLTLSASFGSDAVYNTFLKAVISTYSTIPNTAKQGPAIKPRNALKNIILSQDNYMI